jgi:hypothetical protein
MKSQLGSDDPLIRHMEGASDDQGRPGLGRGGAIERVRPEKGGNAY